MARGAGADGRVGEEHLHRRQPHLAGRFGGGLSVGRDPVPVGHGAQHAVLDRDGSGVVVTDTWGVVRAADCGEGDRSGATRLHRMIAGAVHLTAPGRAEIEPLTGTGTLELSWDPAHHAELEGSSTIPTSPSPGVRA